jgi:putative hemolysin
MISVGREEGAVEEAQASMLHRVFRFGDRPVRHAMTPRPDIVWLERDITLDRFLEVYAQSPHTRYPIYQENTDNVVGLLAIQDVLMAQARGNLGPESPLEGLIRPLSLVPESKPVGQLFNEMQLQGQQMAVVVDEYGSISGIVTMEDLVEEVVGEIRDEWGEPERDFEAIDEHTFQVDGGMGVEEANEQLKLNLPQGDYETVAGFVLSRLGHIPKVGKQLRWGGLKLTVAEVKGMRLEKIIVAREVEPGAAPQG